MVWVTTSAMTAVMVLGFLAMIVMLFGVVFPARVGMPSRWEAFKAACGFVLVTPLVAIAVGLVFGLVFGFPKNESAAQPAPAQQATDAPPPLAVAATVAKAPPRLGALEATVGESAAPRRVAMTWRHVSRADLGDAWPLTTDAAVVGCSPDLPMFSVIVVVDGEPWALNGTTKGWARGGKYRVDIGGTLVQVRVSDAPEAWWAVEPGLVLGGKVGRKSITPLFDVAERIGCLLPPGMSKR